MKNGQTAEQYQCAVYLLVKIWNMEELLTDVPERKTSRKTSRKNEKMTKKNEKCDRGLDKDRTFVETCKYGVEVSVAQPSISQRRIGSNPQSSHAIEL